MSNSVRSWVSSILSRSGRGTRGAGGSAVCRCPKCGYTTPHARGVPCSAIQCPKCGSLMKGEQC